MARAASQQLGEMVEERSGALMAALLCLFFVALVGLSASDYLWYDELVILRVAQLPTWHSIWAFYASGLDTIGLIYALVLHAALHLRADAEISARLPAILMDLAALQCVFLFVCRRYPAVYAFAVVLLLMMYPLLTFAVFAKSYTLEIAGLTFAMLCWQRGTEKSGRIRSALGVWIGLAVAIYAHSFAIFLLIPFAAAQGAADWSRKRLDGKMWAALLLYPAALLPVMRGMLLASRLYGSHFWSQPSSALMKQTYIDYFQKNWRFMAILLAVALVMPLLAEAQAAEQDTGWPEWTGFSLPEWVLVSLLALLPMVVLPLSYLLHAYRADYVLAYAIGLALLLVCGLAERAGRSVFAGAVVCLLFASVTLRVDLKTIPQGVRALEHPRQVHARLQTAYDSAPWVKLLGASDLPVLAGDHLLYTRLDAYAPSQLRSRLYFLTNFAQVDQYPLSDTSQRNFLLFGAILGYQTMDVGRFLPDHREFLLVVEGTSGGLWLEPYLLKQQRMGDATLTFLGPDTDVPSVYGVRFQRLPEFPAAPELRPWRLKLQPWQKGYPRSR